MEIAVIIVLKVLFVALFVGFIGLVVLLTYSKVARLFTSIYLFFGRLFKRFIIWLMMKFLYKNTSTVDTVFSMFINFYDKEFKDAESWELPEEFFPKGKSELSDMYRWIKKVRKENYKERLNLYFDDKIGRFKYWGAAYRTFKYKITDGELKVEPVDNTELSNLSLAFVHRSVKLENDLYDLDSDKAAWIIDRRRFFNL